MKLDGKKTYLGILVTLLGILAKSHNIELGDGEIQQFASLLIDLASYGGLAIAFIGRILAKPKKEDIDKVKKVLTILVDDFNKRKKAVNE